MDPSDPPSPVITNHPSLPLRCWAEIDLAAVHGCADCMIAFTDTPGSFLAVMPGQPGNVWIKEVVKVEVK